MILIDKKASIQTIIFYTDKFSDDLVYLLKINSDSTNESHQFELLENNSTDKYRYLKYTIPTTDFNEVSNGFYNYSMINPDTNMVIRQGKLLIRDEANDDVIIQPESDGNENWIEYNG
ncbi:hypothetical protein OQZ33_07110 [Pedobacter sp. MC2016-05]|uniref:hypothetical protein n=1 Tax=Pedobacter sp. MC2016-05 TaxID=2994474 RepID=UPI002247C7BE|nr:hypothetical protein [Pedobacter sp. MC2016-05]MCX2474094.1 hypothetical protein [Pedobacter sp. MC2016-05]